jgi:hypothetical protein
MSVPITGIVLSAIVGVFLILVFRIERNRGRRLLKSVRGSLDTYVERGERHAQEITRYISGVFVPTLVRFLAHTVLLAFLRLFEKGKGEIEKALRANRLWAKRIKTERTTRNKLDEIAEHKASVAFSEEEKQKHKEKVLFG